ncbi:MAG TPA: TrmH family RNA methyltransferase [Patescibacteria group bacterium]|jgi:tRNA G18 (ribose-2'-O)-methylase SpoU|nr:TrmH family RNA methyltransferase [Patescibacteria group bacterium]
MPRITVVAHNIRSTHNVGSLFRTAEGFGVEKIILSGYTPYPTYGKDRRLPHESAKITAQIHKTALGAESLVPFEVIDNIHGWLTANRLPVIALEQDESSIPLSTFEPPERCVLLLGEEVHGVPKDILAHADHIVEIPMVGQKESFNVSVAAGIALYALTTSK